MKHKMIIPSLFTILNAFLGFWAFIKVTEGEYLYSAWFIILAVLCDGMDGKLARLTDSSHPLGEQMDSLADLISFGVAPVFLLYKMVLFEFGFFGLIISFGFTLSGIYRLARFNVLQKGERTHGYLGLPIPVAAMTISALVLMSNSLGIGIINYFWIFFVVVLSGLMCSNIPYAWPTLQFNNTRNTFYSILLLIGVIAMLVIPRLILFPCIMLYILFGIGNYLRNSYLKVYDFIKENTNF